MERTGTLLTCTFVCLWSSITWLLDLLSSISLFVCLCVCLFVCLFTFLCGKPSIPKPLASGRAESEHNLQKDGSGLQQQQQQQQPPHRPSFRALRVRRGSEGQFSSGEESPREGSVTNITPGVSTGTQTAVNGMGMCIKGKPVFEGHCITCTSWSSLVLATHSLHYVGFKCPDLKFHGRPSKKDSIRRVPSVMWRRNSIDPFVT